MNAIELNHVNKSFGAFAIRDLTLAVPSGTICGLVGENGAGKSTTIRRFRRFPRDVVKNEFPLISPLTICLYCVYCTCTVRTEDLPWN